jgi:general stress protein 26
MDWDEFVEAARAISWVAYLATADAAGMPHSSVVSPGFSDDRLWVATRRESKKYRNLTVNPRAALYWPVGGEGPGELSARGSVLLHDSPAAIGRIWDSGYFSYELASFFGSPDNLSLAFVEVRLERARLLGPGFVASVWTPRRQGPV